VNPPEGSSRDGEVLAERGHDAPVGESHAGDHRVRGQRLLLHPEMVAVMLRVKAPFLECPRLKEVFDPVARRKKGLMTARLELVLPGAGLGGFTALFEFVE
jgi:hypothetical protein